MTLLYQDFKDKHIKHLPLWKLENLHILAIEAGKLSSDAYLPIWLVFSPLWLGTDILYVMSQHFRHHVSLCHWSHQELPNSGDKY